MQERRSPDWFSGEPEGRRRIVGQLVGVMVQACIGLVLAANILAASTVRFAESGDALVIENPGDGGSFKESIPLYGSGKVRYFSAGVGIEERSVAYPPFALKLVFTAGGRPYVAGVSLRVERAAGGAVVNIPGEHVGGPWLFLDLPEGRYRIRATMGGVTKELSDVRVKEGESQTLYLRWAEYREQPLESKAD